MIIVIYIVCGLVTLTVLGGLIYVICQPPYEDKKRQKDQDLSDRDDNKID